MRTVICRLFRKIFPLTSNPLYAALPLLLLSLWPLEARCQVTVSVLVFSATINTATTTTTVTNNTGSSVTITGDALTGTGSNNGELTLPGTGGTCAVSGGAISTLGPSGSCTISVTFTPTVPGFAFNSLQVTLAGGTHVNGGLQGTGFGSTPIIYVDSSLGTC